ncbi:lysophospholipid acyltransferase family protein [Alkanindiges sp. WGS2144]|uniref:lysophospholipid acyltransferase family protein n=1 Tax=Alkanindiges sp. WGS2144 TaxID=3366808 RepID=UPI0037521282
MTQVKPAFPQPLAYILTWLGKLPLPLLQWLARGSARLLGLNKSTKAITTIERNLLIAFPHLRPVQRQLLAKQALTAQLQSMLEFIKCWGSSPQWSIRQIKQVTGQHLLIQAIEQKKGLILVVPHFGSWELMNAWLSQFTATVIMYKPSKNAQLDQFVLAARNRLRATLVPADESGVRQIFKALKQGGVTAILPDHTPEPSGGIYSPFFGCPLLTSTLVSKLAQKTQCAVLQMYCLRQPDQPGFSIHIEPMDDTIRSASLQQSVDCLNASIEQLIQAHPAHYHWTYKRFKANPALEDIYYQDDAQVADKIKTSQQEFFTTAH